MSFQWVIEHAETLSINRKKMVATTSARNGMVRAVSRGTLPKTFTVKLPDGMQWSKVKDNIIALEALDKISTGTISIDYSRFPWYYGNIAPGANETYDVRCVEFPEWTLFAYDQVSWSGAFVFQEVLNDY